MKEPAEDPLRPHSFDGIQEYDKKMPNWWLFTLYATIAFSIGYWTWHHVYAMSMPDGLAVEETMRENARIAARNTREFSDPVLWEMSRDPQVVSAGKSTYMATCAVCHVADLSGMVGPNLKDQAWVHGAEPLTVMRLIDEGVAAKGMPGWGPMLGKQKIGELTAFILSHHKEGEPVTIAPWVPGAPPAPAAPAAP